MHVMLIISLLFGELATSVHLVGHLHEHRHHHEHAHGYTSGNFAARAGDVSRQPAKLTAGHPRIVPIPENSGSQHTGEPHEEGIASRDCGLYHAFSGLQACLVEPAEPASPRFGVVAGATFHIEPTVANAVAVSRIRGPPIFS